MAVTANPAAGSAALKPGIYEGQVTVTYAHAAGCDQSAAHRGGNWDPTCLSRRQASRSRPASADRRRTRRPSWCRTVVRGSGPAQGGHFGHRRRRQLVERDHHAGARQPAGQHGHGNGERGAADRRNLLWPGRPDAFGCGQLSAKRVGGAARPGGPATGHLPAGVVITSTYLFGSPGIPVQPQTVTLTNLSTHPVNFTATGRTGNRNTGASMDWLTFSPASGQMGPGGGTARVTASVPAACFAAGDPCRLWFDQFGGISFHYVEDNYTAGINVQLDIPDVMGALGITGQVIAHSSPRLAAACVPWQANGVFTSLPIGFQATVGLPVSLQVEILDSCAQAMNTGTVVATFSNGDPPVALTPIGGGLWDGTWTPQRAATQAVITVQAAKSDMVAGLLKLSGAVAANTATPIAYAGGIVNAASGAATIAPGTFIAIYGAYFGATSVASSYPFPALLGGTQVLLGGKPVPLYFTSSGQIDAIVPYDIAPNSMQQMIVLNGAASSQPQTVLVGAAQPGVFTQNQGGTGPGAILGRKGGRYCRAEHGGESGQRGRLSADLLHGAGHGDAGHRGRRGCLLSAAVLCRQQGHGNGGRARRAGRVLRTGSGICRTVPGERAGARGRHHRPQRAGGGDRGRRRRTQRPGDGRNQIGRERWVRVRSRPPLFSKINCQAAWPSATMYESSYRSVLLPFGVRAQDLGLAPRACPGTGDGGSSLI